MINRSHALESASTVECLGETLLTIAHLPQNPSHVGVLIIVGGPQYRIGSHRQYVLLARFLANHGIPVFRFDSRGMGDSTGEFQNFLQLGDDIRCAIDAFFDQCPSLKEVCIWGLCDAATAALLYSVNDSRVSSLILLNPWVRTEQSLAATQLRSYYWKKILDRRSLQRAVSSLPGFLKRIREITQTFRKAFQAKSLTSEAELLPISHSRNVADPNRAPYVDWMLDALRKFDGPVLFILSENDITAAEFRRLVDSNSGWKKACYSVKNDWREIRDANHTFSSQDHRNIVATLTTNWVKHL